jgi:hypothetical protein
MKYAIEMSLVATTHIPSFIKTVWGIHKLIKGDSQTHRQHGDRMSIL